MSTLALALLEGAALFAGVSGITALAGVPAGPAAEPSAATVVVQALVFAGCCLVAFYYNDLYDLRIVRDFPAFALRLTQAVGVAFILMAILYALLPEARLTWGVFIGTVLLLLGLLVPGRAVFYTILRRRAFAERVLVIGTGDLGAELVRLIEAAPECGQRVVAVVSDNGGEESLEGPPVVGPLERLGKLIDEHRPERIVVAMRERRGRLPLRDLLEAQASGLVVEDGVDLYERLTGKIAIENLTPSQLIFSPAFRISRRRRLVRRLVNLAVAAVGLALTAPLMLAIAVAIRLDSPGPVFFRQQRCGRGGRLFWLVKFRTMRESPAGPAGSVWERDDSGRVTRVGRWLRRTRLDELPQFWNILKGDMALVGPRPEMAANVEAMTERIPYYALRHRIEPGVTGWAQVRQGYAVTVAEVTEKIRYDLYYVKHMSLWLDLRVLLDTVKIVLFGRGAR